MDENIYDDLNSFDLGVKITKLQDENSKLIESIKTLRGDIEKLCTELTHMKSTERTLTNNISELFNTSKTELQRKDRIIADLRSQVDDLVFKRYNKQNYNNYKKVENAPAADSNVNGKRNRNDSEEIVNKKVKTDRASKSPSRNSLQETNSKFLDNRYRRSKSAYRTDNHYSNENKREIEGVRSPSRCSTDLRKQFHDRSKSKSRYQVTHTQSDDVVDLTKHIDSKYCKDSENIPQIEPGLSFFGRSRSKSLYRDKDANSRQGVCKEFKDIDDRFSKNQPALSSFGRRCAKSRYREEHAESKQGVCKKFKDIDDRYSKNEPNLSSFGRSRSKSQYRDAHVESKQGVCKEFKNIDERFSKNKPNLSSFGRSRSKSRYRDAHVKSKGVCKEFKTIDRFSKNEPNLSSFGRSRSKSQYRDEHIQSKQGVYKELQGFDDRFSKNEPSLASLGRSRSKSRYRDEHADSKKRVCKELKGINDHFNKTSSRNDLFNGDKNSNDKYDSHIYQSTRNNQNRDKSSYNNEHQRNESNIFDNTFVNNSNNGTGENFKMSNHLESKSNNTKSKNSNKGEAKELPLQQQDLRVKIISLKDYHTRKLQNDVNDSSVVDVKCTKTSYESELQNNNIKSNDCATSDNITTEKKTSEEIVPVNKCIEKPTENSNEVHIELNNFNVSTNNDQRENLSASSLSLSDGNESLNSSVRITNRTNLNGRRRQRCVVKILG